MSPPPPAASARAHSWSRAPPSDPSPSGLRARALGGCAPSPSCAWCRRRPLRRKRLVEYQLEHWCLYYLLCLKHRIHKGPSSGPPFKLPRTWKYDFERLDSWKAIDMKYSCQPGLSTVAGIATKVPELAGGSGLSAATYWGNIIIKQHFCLQPPIMKTINQHLLQCMLTVLRSPIKFPLVNFKELALSFADNHHKTNFIPIIIIISTLTELGLGVRIALIRICFFVERGVTGQDLTWCIQIIYTTEEM